MNGCEAWFQHLNETFQLEFMMQESVENALF